MNISPTTMDQYNQRGMVIMKVLVNHPAQMITITISTGGIDPPLHLSLDVEEECAIPGGQPVESFDVLEAVLEVHQAFQMDTLDVPNQQQGHLTVEEGAITFSGRLNHGHLHDA